MSKFSRISRQFAALGSAALSRFFSERLEADVDELDAMTPEAALSRLGAIDDPTIDADDQIDEAAAEQVRVDVEELLRIDAPRAELELLRGLDALLLDRAIEGLSNVFRRTTRNNDHVTWTSEQDVVVAGNVVVPRSELQLEVARYLDIWADDQSNRPAREAVNAVAWARRASVRLPLLFRHVRVVDVSDKIARFEGQPRSIWSMPRRMRWSRLRHTEAFEAVAYANRS